MKWEKSGPSLPVRFAAWSGRVFLLCFALYTLYRQGSTLNLFQVAQQLLVVGLLVWRVRRQAALPVVPDFFLVALPYFWLLSLYPAVSDWFSLWQLPLLAVFALTTLSGLSRLRQVEANVLQGTIIAAGFIVFYATMLRQFFPLFGPELFTQTLLNCAAFFCGLPVCYLSLQACLTDQG